MFGNWINDEHFSLALKILFLYSAMKENVELIISGSVKRFKAPGTEKNYQKSLNPFTIFSPKTH